MENCKSTVKGVELCLDLSCESCNAVCQLLDSGCGSNFEVSIIDFLLEQIRDYRDGMITKVEFIDTTILALVEKRKTWIS